jgi:hypothetical protein
MIESEAHYLNLEELYKELTVNDRDYALKYIVTKKKLLELMERYAVDQVHKNS